MTDRNGTTKTRAQIIVFSPRISIEKSKLDRAILGAAKSGDPELREEMLSKVYLRLAKHFALGRPVTRDLTSLASNIAGKVRAEFYRSAFKRRRKDGLDVGDAVPAPGAREEVESPEERLLRLATTEMMRRTLSAAIAQLSSTDCDALAAMLERTEPLPRNTPAQTKAANLIAQREKRAKDRLRKAVRERGGAER